MSFGTLMATRAMLWRSVHSYTLDAPPLPISRTTRYRPPMTRPMRLRGPLARAALSPLGEGGGRFAPRSPFVGVIFSLVRIQSSELTG